MAFQGERVPGDLEIVESMAQDEIPEQDIVVEELELPQMNPEPEMAAAHGAPPPPSSKSRPAPQRNRDRSWQIGPVRATEREAVHGNVGRNATIYEA